MKAAAREDARSEWDRRTLAIMVADAVGYSRLMEADEAETHRRMRALRVDVIDPSIVSYRGEIVKNTGDGFVASFESALDATLCASRLQTLVDEKERSRPADRRIAFRIGVNLEHVIVDAQDVFGGGVNVAARLQQHAVPGGVVISSSVKDVVGAGLSGPAEDLGELHLKNMLRPVHAFALAAPGRSEPAASLRSPDEGTRAHLPTLAVLPLRNLSADPSYNYMAEGVIEDLIVSFAGLHDLFVISRGSTLGLGASATVDEVSGRLGVRYVLAGSVLPLADRLRLSFELTDIRAGTILWADRFECAPAELFGLQNHVVEQVVARVAAHVRRAEIGRARRKEPGKLDAYDYLLRALGLLYRFDFASFSQAGGLLRQAIEADPDYAAPYSYLAKWHIFNVGQGWSGDASADGREAARLASLATERDPADSLAHALYGHAQGMLFRDYDAAIDGFERATATSPSSSWAWILSSGTYGFVGQAEVAIARAERAIRLTPVDQQAFYFFCLLAQNHYLGGSYEEALVWARKALRHNPRFCNAIRIAAASSAALGRDEDARRATAQLLQVQPRFTVSGYEPNCPLKDPRAVQSYLRHLRLAGMPD